MVSRSLCLGLAENFIIISVSLVSFKQFEMWCLYYFKSEVLFGFTHVWFRLYVMCILISCCNGYENTNFEAVTNLMHKYLYSYYIRILYMFWALLCSSSGGSIVYVQHLVPSLSVSGGTLHRLRENSSLLTGVTYGRSQRVTVPDAVRIQLNLLKMSIIMLKTCRGL